MIELFLATLALIILSGLWSGTETALLSIDLDKAKQMNTEGKCTALFLKLIEEKDAYISTLVFLNNIVNIAGSMFVAGMAMNLLGAGFLNAAFSLSLTVLIIVFAEILPKTIGANKSKEIVSVMSKPLQLAKWLLNPLVIVVTKFSNKILKMLFGEIVAESVSENEIGYLVEQGAKDANSEIRHDEAQVIKRVFQLNDTKAKEIMTPRICVTWIFGSNTLSSVAEKVKSSEHSRILVVGETIDDIQGVAYKDTLLIALSENKHDSLISDLDIDKIRSVNEDTSASSLLKIFQKDNRHIATVNDEHGGISGVVTLEDVLEILVGEIVDETDSAVDLRQVAAEHKSLRRFRQKYQD